MAMATLPARKDVSVIIESTLINAEEEKVVEEDGGMEMM